MKYQKASEEFLYDQVGDREYCVAYSLWLVFTEINEGHNERITHTFSKMPEL